VSKYKPLIEKRVSDAAGRPVSVGNDLQLSLFHRAGLTLSDLRRGNPPGFAEKDFLTVKSLDVRVRLLPLLSKDIRVQRFILNKPDIVLIKNKEIRGTCQGLAQGLAQKTLTG
jgi:AsmA protein